MSPRRFDADGRLTHPDDLDRWGYETERNQRGYREERYSSSGERRRSRARIDRNVWPEEYSPPRREATRQSHRGHPRRDFGDDYEPPTARRLKPGRLAGLVWLALGLGLMIDGGAVNVSPNHYSLGLQLFWAGLLVPFVTFALVLVAGRPSRALRQFTVVLLGLYPTLIYRVNGPFVLRAFDEHLHERTLTDLLHGSGLFAPNPLLPVSPYYPGLELFTGSLVRLTGVPVMFAMNVVPLLARLLLVLVIYQAALAVTRSYRRASLVVIFYSADPGFYFFNSIFSYQTLALTLGIGGITLLYRAQLARDAGRARALSTVGTLALVATVVTHHATSWMVLAFLIAWSVAERRGERRIVVRATAIMAVCAAAWTALTWSRISIYMGPIFASVATEASVFLGHEKLPHLFADNAGTVLPLWQRATLIIYAVLGTGAALISGYAVLRRAFRTGNRVLGLVGLLSMMYPSTLAAHFVIANRALAGQFGNRATSFMLLPVALCLAMVVPNPKIVPHLDRRSAAMFLLSLVGGATIAYVGGVTLGAGPDYEYLPGHYLAAADTRVQDPQTLAAVQWAAAHIPAGSRIVAGRMPADLLAARARLWPVRFRHGIDPAKLYFANTWNSSLSQIVEQLNIRYIYVDKRLASSLPHLGYYFYAGETSKPTRIPLAALTKFSHVPELAAIYHHGPITIYDTAGLGTTNVRDGFTGNRPMGPSAPLGVITGAVIGAVLLVLRRRLHWVGRAVHNAGVAGTTLGVIGVIIFVSGVLFGLRLMPGPSFTLGAVEMLLVTIAVQRRLTGRRFFPRLPHASRVDPLVVLGLIATAFGLIIALHAAWSMDVTDADQILRAVTAAHHKPPS